MSPEQVNMIVNALLNVSSSIQSVEHMLIVLCVAYLVGKFMD